ncbi:MAG: hypothetical protein CMO01_25165 [Thalassobius sp.]|nr:hypothetical protein [Thalassovita sp.]
MNWKAFTIYFIGHLVVFTSLNVFVLGNSWGKALFLSTLISAFAGYLNSSKLSQIFLNKLIGVVLRKKN